MYYKTSPLVQEIKGKVLSTRPFYGGIYYACIRESIPALEDLALFKHIGILTFLASLSPRTNLHSEIDWLLECSSLQVLFPWAVILVLA